MNDGIERRKHKRQEAKFIVMCKVIEPSDLAMKYGGREIDGLMLDISEGGMALVTSEDIPAKAILLLKFTFIDPTSASDHDRIKSIEARGEVRYIIPSAKGEYRLGIQFTRINEENKHAIAEFVARTGGVFNP